MAKRPEEQADALDALAGDKPAPAPPVPPGPTKPVRAAAPTAPPRRAVPPGAKDQAGMPLPSAPRRSRPREPSRPTESDEATSEAASRRRAAFALSPHEAPDALADAAAERPAALRSSRPELRREPSAVRAARTGIPLCLLATVGLPILAVAWLALDATSPLKLGGGWVPPTLLAIALVAGGAAYVMMRRVADHYA